MSRGRAPSGGAAGLGAPGVRPADDEHPLGTAQRVLVFSVPTLTWADLRDYRTPNLERAAGESVVGDLSVRSVTRRTGPADGYATLNAGTRTEGTPQGSLAFVAGLDARGVDDGGDPTGVPPGAFENDPPEDDLPTSPLPDGGGSDTRRCPARRPPRFPRRGALPGVPAVEEFARRTGVMPPVGSVFNFGIVSIRQLNDSLLFDAEVGALGDALAGAGVRRAVIANGDHGVGEEDVDFRREASLGLMDSEGIVERGG
ncbi:MAG: hypothetical protein R2716_04030 [Microthrixaceae bacterium]